MKIMITSLEIGGCPVPVPPGLAELLSDPKGWVPKSEIDEVTGYESRTYRENGKWFTEITPQKGERHESIKSI